MVTVGKSYTYLKSTFWVQSYDATTEEYKIIWNSGQDDALSRDEIEDGNLWGFPVVEVS